MPSHWFYLVMKCFLEKEGAAEAKRALPGAGAVQQPEGKHLALAGRGSELSNTSPSSKAMPRRSGKEQAGERRGVAPVTFPFVQALQEWLELLLVEDRALRVPLPQHHPGVLQPGDLKVDGADGGCWGQRSPWALRSGLPGCSQGGTAWPRSHGPQLCTQQCLLLPKTASSTSAQGQRQHTPGTEAGFSIFPPSPCPRTAASLRRSGLEDETQGGGSCSTSFVQAGSKTSQLGLI